MATSSSTDKQTLSLPNIFSNNMVLQRDQALPIWGWSIPGSEVTLEISDQKKSTKTNENGRWEITLNPLKTNSAGIKMTVSTNADKIILENILVGEVWLCSGQSNMEFALTESNSGKEEISNIKNPQIRIISIAPKTSSSPLRDFPGEWVPLTKETAPNFSAIAYFYSEKLHKALNVPIGLINSSFGNTRIEPWISNQSIQKISKLKKSTTIPAAHIDYKNLFKQSEKWLARAVRTIAAGKFPKRLPLSRFNQLGRGYQPAALYNAMIHPIVPFGIRGVIWYQGEANITDGALYEQKMKALINGWRNSWDQGALPFYYVQLAPYKDFSGEYLGSLWESQFNILKSVRNTGMVVTTDIGNLNDIHPKNKKDVGHRLALWALAKTYGVKNLNYSGPLYKKHEIKGNQIIVHFDHASDGLSVGTDKEVQDVYIQAKGDSTPFIKAHTKIKDNTLIISHPDIKEPKAARMGWNKNAQPNLKNAAELPASPFRTDTETIH